MVRRSLMGIGFAVAALVAFQVTGCGGSNDGGGAGSNGHGGTTGSAGTTGGAGTSGQAGTGTAGSGFGQPACPGTVTKGGACTATDMQLCYKNCGPQNIGRKSETCTNSAYVEMDGCSYDPAGTFACYKIPTTANAACPAGVTPQASQACTVTDMCTLCNSAGGLAAGMYMDSNAAAKTGFCVCVNSKWSCASSTAWPCPNGAGCQ